MIRYKQHSIEEEILGILKLQRANVENVLASDEVQREGFVTVKHKRDDLKLICGPYGHTIAKVDEEVIGYALTMLPDYSEDIEVLKPMFDTLSRLKWKTQNFNEYNYLAMGQVCVDKRYRGKGIFRGLYDHMRFSFSSHYDFVVTEIAKRNIRSLKAHQKVGFKTIHRFKDSTDDWEIVLWDWRNNKIE